MSAEFDAVGRAQRQARLDASQNTIARLEPEIAIIDQGAAEISTAISLKRIADSLEKIAAAMGPEGFPFQIQNAIETSIFNSRR